jgi:hypothetical protein
LQSREPDRARIRMSAHLLGVEEFSAAHADEDPQAYRAPTSTSPSDT